MEKEIIYFGQKTKVVCDEKCNKAWGLSARPRVQLSDDEDDCCWLADGELGEAPADPGTYEGGHGKPYSPVDAPNKWCVRECERCKMSERGKYDEPLRLEDWSKRVYNQPYKHPEVDNENNSAD